MEYTLEGNNLVETSTDTIVNKFPMEYVETRIQQLSEEIASFTEEKTKLQTRLNKYNELKKTPDKTI